MKVLDPGHRYRLQEFDGYLGQLRCEPLQFVKREGPGYPGNVGIAIGTNCQEVLRALIDRTQYLNGQEAHHLNEVIIDKLRDAIYAFEVRAALRHGRTPPPREGIELAPTCPRCGHVGCDSTCLSGGRRVQLR